MSLALKMLSAQEAERYPFGHVVINDGRKILNQNVEEVPVGEIVHEFIAFGLESGIATSRKIHTDNVMVHIENRGKLMLNWNNAHRNGSSIARVGANLKELHGAVCFEVSTDPTKRKELQAKAFYRFI